jgi:hypothetical protein
MCHTAILDGKEYETVRELREICPAIVEVEGYPLIQDEGDSDDVCLCAIDAKGTFRENGFRFWDDGVQFVLKRKGVDD